MTNSTEECTAVDETTFICECISNYTWNEFALACESDEQVVYCTGLPENAIWNTVEAITQTWNGSSWIPSNTATYDMESSTTECRFKCAVSYHWEDSACVSDTKTGVACSDKPENTEWNGEPAYTSIYSDGVWSTVATEYNEANGECHYICSDNFYPLLGQCTNGCVINGENPCNNMPNAIYDSCTPTGSNTFTCGCADGYFWDGSSCFSPCSDSSCGENSDGTCTAINLSYYYCGCNAGYSWNAGSCKEYSTGLTVGQICTNQTKCYGTSEIECPAVGEDFFGQDAQYANSKSCTFPSFQIDETAESEKTIIDNNTNLEWQKTLSTTTFSWEESYIYCDTLSYGGHSDWRLPTPQEVLTIVDNGRYNPAVYRTYFSNIPYDAGFWTSGKYDSSNAFYFNTYLGSIGYDFRDSSYRAMCVRGLELPASTFTVSTVGNDAIVTDDVTGLVWQSGYVSKPWQQALEYCEGLNYGGYSDWRLPNKNELSSLINSRKGSSAYSGFPNMPEGYFWSSTTQHNSSDSAWYAGFGEGLISTLNKTESIYVRCVRSELCTEGNFWNGTECITDPCQSDSCDIAHSTGFCQPRTATTFVCVCEEGYFWNEGTCEPTPETICINAGGTWNASQNDCTRSVPCSSKPSNTVWNDVGYNHNGAAGTFTQTWNGSAWNPASYSSSYSTTAGTCVYKCATNYNWNSSNGTCDAATQPGNCSSKPANTVWNDGGYNHNGAAGTFTQTWNGEAWSPASYTSTYNETAGVCRYKCANSYHRENNQCVSNTKNNVSCTGLIANAEWWNGVSTLTQTWDGEAWTPSAAGSYGTSAGTCKYKCKTNYNWENSQCVAATQKADCSSKPENTVWNDNGANGKFTQTWNGSAWDPASYASTYNETAGVCRYKCADTYHLENNQCVSNTKTGVACSSKPENTVWNDNGSNGTFTQTWNGEAWSPASYTSTYNETAGVCRYKCADTYHLENNQCVSNTKNNVACTGLIANAEWWNGVSTLTQTWNGESWTPSAAGSYGTSAGTCKYKCKTNYNWENSQCVAATQPGNCSSKPANTVWNDGGYNHNGAAGTYTQTWNGEAWDPASYASTYNETAGVCRYKCADTYHLENNQCVSNTKTGVACSSKPENTVWNDNGANGTFTQTWNGEAWSPASYTSTYNETAGICRYKCADTYHLENNQCVSNTKTNVSCTGKPTNASWNTAETITQTWNGSGWQPSSTGVYNEEASTSECRYKCADTYHLENNQCVSNTKTGVACSSKPENTVWNDNGANGTFTQTWNGEAWSPASYTSIYNETAGVCRYKCANSYHRENNQCVSNTKTNVACTGKPSNASWNTAETITQTWNGSGWQPSSTGVYNEEASTSECRYKCGTHYTWHNSQCVATLGNICTGQTLCYNSSSSMTCPAAGEDFFGQDAQYVVPENGNCIEHSFSIDETVESEKTVVDNNTGLEWQQTLTTETFNWDDAETYCNSLTYGGHNDWRLPTPQEFLTIADSSKYYPAVAFTNISNSYFWTSKFYNASNVFIFRPDYGLTGYDSKSTGSYRAMCVRGNELPTSTFTTSDEEDIVTDNVTGLVWQKEYVTGKTWLQALEYCENLDYAGYTDWRLPNKNELASLVNNDKTSSPYSDFPDMLGSSFWSSSTSYSSYSSAWVTSFYYGTAGTTGKTNTNYVRCVRSDICGSGEFWNGSACVTDPCQSNSCTMNHATGVCQPRTSSTFECICEDGYFWNGSACVNPCDNDPCGAHSDGTCTALSFNVYYCGCESGYSWNAGSCREYSTDLTLGNICTGQTLCYNSSSSMTCPAAGEDFFGQDAQYVVPENGNCIEHSFSIDETVESEKTVVDNNTGIEWQQTLSTETFTWEKAYIYCDTLSYGGHSDWRLPTQQEFLTIVNNGKYGPAVDKTYFPNMPSSTNFWTSKLYNASNAFYFYTYTGSTNYASKSSSYRAMCVRGSELPTSTFTTSAVEDDEIVTDNVTGLLWQKGYVTGKNWLQALEYCEDLSYAGYTDWRLPNKNELASLVNNDKTSSPRSDFPNMPGQYFWSSSTPYSSYGSAWGVRFDTGYTSYYDKSSSYYVRCVRSDICGSGEFWNGSECVADSCQSNSCTMTHATGVCQPRTSSTFECICEDGYFWNGSACVSPCESDPCGAHSDGSCTALSLNVYYCGCEAGYSWNAGLCREYSTDLTLGNICTGQTKCYNNSPSMTCPSAGEDFFGQDAQYANSGSCYAKSFSIDSSVETEKTVVDNNTGLEWQQTLSTNTFTWEKAYIYCDTLSYGGHSDWRLPTPQEFLTIVDNGRYSPAVEKTTYFTNMPGGASFWTSKIYNASIAFYFYTYYGSTSYISKSSSYRAMCVRGAELPVSTFTTSDEEDIVTDNVTGLVWQKGYVTGKTWQQALEYCENLDYAGYTDWRLPNKNELASLVNNDKTSSPYSDFPNMPGKYFWSSSTISGGTDSAWRVYFDYGYVYYGGKGYSSYYVRCVR